MNNRKVKKIISFTAVATIAVSLIAGCNSGTITSQSSSTSSTSTNAPKASASLSTGKSVNGTPVGESVNVMGWTNLDGPHPKSQQVLITHSGRTIAIGQYYISFSDRIMDRGRSWEIAKIDGDTYNTKYTINQVIEGDNGVIVAVGAAPDDPRGIKGGTIITSQNDGKDWSAKGVYAPLVSVVYNSKIKTFFAVGASLGTGTAVFSSTDGINWKPKFDSYPTAGPVCFALDKPANAVAYDDGVEMLTTSPAGSCFYSNGQLTEDLYSDYRPGSVLSYFIPTENGLLGVNQSGEVFSYSKNLWTKISTLPWNSSLNYRLVGAYSFKEGVATNRLRVFLEGHKYSPDLLVEYDSIDDGKTWQLNYFPDYELRGHYQGNSNFNVSKTPDNTLIVMTDSYLAAQEKFSTLNPPRSSLSNGYKDGSCSNIKWDGMTLQAMCYRSGQLYSMSLDYTTCPSPTSPVKNTYGHLECASD